MTDTGVGRSLPPASVDHKSVWRSTVRAILRPVKDMGSHAFLGVNYIYDLQRFAAWSASSRRRLTDAQLESRLLQKAHSIEKGLAMPAVRPGFGGVALRELRNLMADYRRRGLDPNRTGFQMASHAIGAYLDHHRSTGSTIPDELRFVADLAVAESDPECGGVRRVTAKDVVAGAQGDFASLVRARHSIRSLAPGNVEPQLIESAVSLALRSPSVCNRQGGRVHVLTDPVLKAKALEIQGGNRGFSEEIDTVLIVTQELGIFRGARERNQAWIDGGLFAMTLLYGLAYVGLGACPLNWSSDRKQDLKLRRLLALPENEVVIMMIGVGLLRDEFAVATSPRRALVDVLAPIGGR